MRIRIGKLYITLYAFYENSSELCSKTTYEVLLLGSLRQIFAIKALSGTATLNAMTRRPNRSSRHMIS